MSEAERAQERVPFHRPTIEDEDIAEVVAVLRSGWLTTGPRVRQFEEAFASYVGARHAVALNSGTAGLHLALEAAGIRPGDEVIIPTYTFTATGEVVTYLGAQPVLADCVAGSFNLDVRSVEARLSPRTRAIVPVHIAGQMCAMDEILALARDRSLCVVEDAAHALPARYRGRMVGTVGDFTTFSFYATKTITTGEGGMVTTARDDWAERMRRMSLHGLSGDAWRRYADKGRWYYEVLDFGFKYNLTDVAAALGVAQLRRADAFAARRREIARQYSAAFGELDGCRVPAVEPDVEHAWHLYVLQLELEALRADRGAVIAGLTERGIGTSVHFIPLHLQPVYQKRLGYRRGDFPVAERVFERAVSLPIYPSMTEAQVARVIDAVQAVLGELRR